MKITYEAKRFRGDTLVVVTQANRIMLDLYQQGYDLTLRQLYYQFVSKGWLENTEKNYKRLGTIVSDARLAGLLDWDIMVDRTRELRRIAHWDSPAEIVRACADQYRIDTRADQDTYVEVWVEKEALAGIVLDACRDLDLHALVCRGFVSQSTMWQAAQRFEQHSYQTRIILHLGDHDPSGIDMTRDIDDRLNETFGGHVTVERIGLTMAQITQYNPPPNPAKVTDSRYRAYVKHYGTQSWELDALSPAVLRQLIVDSVGRYTEDDRRAALLARQDAQRAQLRRIAEKMEKGR